MSPIRRHFFLKQIKPIFAALRSKPWSLLGLRLVQAWIIKCIKCSKIEKFLTGCIFRLYKKQPSLMRFTQYV